MADVPTRDEVRAALAAATIVARAITGSKSRAQEFVQEAFERVMTTRPWSRSDGPFDRHLIGAVKSLVSHARTSKRPEQEEEAHDGFHREIVGHAAASPEEQNLEQGEMQRRQSSAEGELAALEASIAGNAVAVAVLRCRREDELTKAGEIAAKLGVPVEQVYRANELIREHLRRLRASRKESEEG